MNMDKNTTPPTILRNLYAKLESMEKECMSASTSTAESQNITNASDNKVSTLPVSTLPVSTFPVSTLPPSSILANDYADVKKKKPSNAVEKINDVVEKISKLSIGNEPQIFNYPSSSQDSNNANYSSLRRNGKGVYNDKENEYSALKLNQYIRTTTQAPTTPIPINTQYNQQPKFANSINQDEFYYDTTFETDIPKYNINTYGSSLPKHLETLGSSSINKSYMFSPEPPATFYNELNVPNIDEYGNNVSDYRPKSSYSLSNVIMNEYTLSQSNINNSFDLNADLEGMTPSIGGITYDEANESFSDSNSLLCNTEIDMEFDETILKGKKPKYMKDLVTSNNFHKGGELTICTNYFFNKKKTLFYALTTHRFYAFKEDRSDAVLIDHYTINKDTKVSKANIYSGVRTFELNTVKNGSKQREAHEFECISKDERDEWIHAIAKVVQLHKYRDKTLPPAPGTKNSKSYTSTLRTPSMKPVYPTPNISPDISQSNKRNSFINHNKHMSATIGQLNKYDGSMLNNGTGGGIFCNNTIRTPQQPIMISSSGSRPIMAGYSPSLTQLPPSSPNINYNKKRHSKMQVMGSPPLIQNRNPPMSPRLNYFSNSPMLRPQGI